jgi:hypothetical protein
LFDTPWIRSIPLFAPMVNVNFESFCVALPLVEGRYLKPLSKAEDKVG